MLGPFNWRNLVAFAHDVAAAIIAWCAAYYLRFNFEIFAPFDRAMWTNLVWVLPVQALIFWRVGMYRGLWRYASLTDLQRIVLAAALGAMSIALVGYVGRTLSIPRSIVVLYPILLGMIMGGSRIAYRAWKEGRLTRLETKSSKRVIVLGAGAAAADLLSSLGRHPDWRFVGLLDDNPAKLRREIHGVPVLGSLEELPQIAARVGADLAVVAMPGASHSVRRRAVDLAAQANLAAMTVPSYDDLMSGKVTVSQLRRIELDDLLGRDPVALDDAGLHAFLDGRTVLVTGAGGSIGAELCRQIARFAPRQIVLFELSELALYSIEQEFRDRFPKTPVAAAIGDAKDAARVAEVFARYRPQVVFHAAAYKHVPLMEEDNAFQAVANNVLSTLVIGRAASACGAERCVLVSTDKAVNPVNVMGASKRLAELVCQALQHGSATQFVIVRFGNVLGSTGSVVPRFREQIARGGPVTVTHPDIQRYFMSIPEATQLVLQAALMGRGGEIYVLDMGEPVKIADLARQMIRLSGFSKEDIGIEYTGLRPGEKLYEEPLADAEKTLPTPHPKLRIAAARPPQNDAVLEEVLAWLQGRDESSPDAVRASLQRWVPEYRPRSDPPSPAAPRKPGR